MMLPYATMISGATLAQYENFVEALKSSLLTLRSAHAQPSNDATYISYLIPCNRET